MFPILLLTRTEPNAKRVLAAVEARLGHAVDHVISPLIRIEDIDGPTPSETELILTSPEGARRAVELGTHGRAWCVGDSTARIASEAGFTVVNAGADAQALIATILDQRPDAPMVHLRGQHQRGDIVEALTRAHLTCRSQITYDQVAQPLTVQALDALGGERPVVLPLFSPRTTRILLTNSDTITAPVTYVAISAAAANGVDPVRVAPVPGFDSMIETICAATLHAKAS